jgi:hypothetical protein
MVALLFVVMELSDVRTLKRSKRVAVREGGTAAMKAAGAGGLGLCVTRL